MHGSRPNSGFSLIEVSLAILVMAVGLTVVVTLFPAGLNQNKIAADETQAALFAEDVFNTLQALANSQSWSSFISDAADIPISSSICNTNKIVLNNSSQDTVRTIQFNAEGNSFTDHALRYRIKRTGTASDPVLKVGMEIWPGLSGTNSTANAITFYTELYDMGL